MLVKLKSQIQEIGPEVWKTFEAADYPFMDYDFLLALTESGSIGGESGWDPAYLLAEDAGGLRGILPSFVKGHSYGEYIFDWEWARFYQKFQQPYYPKFVHAVPFTPATGPRILTAPGGDPVSVQRALAAAAVQVAENSGLSSVHALFIPEAEIPIFEQSGFAIRHSLQYHWRNRNYRDFQDYLDSFIGKRRRDIQRERQRAGSGLTIRCLTGSDLSTRHAELMEQFYEATAEKKEAIPYLREGFFPRVFESMRDRILLVVAEQQGRMVAGALNFYKGKSLFGRYWGCLEEFRDLHFELCYYQTIDFAIQKGLALFEAGAQGEHKIQRGFLPSLTLSAHRLFHPQFRPPIERFIQEEKAMIGEALRELEGKSPFKSS